MNTGTVQLARPLAGHGEHELIRDAVATTRRSALVPGLSIAVTSRDELLYAGALGWANLAERRPAGPSTSYLWLSMSTVVTATAAMRLSDEGRLDLNAPVSSYLDGVTAPGLRQPTTRHLLAHTSGLANPVPLRWVHLADEPAPDPSALLHRQLSRRGAFRGEVGGTPRYSNLGYLAAAEVIRVVAGMPFEEYVRHAILEPAGMSATGFHQPQRAGIATGYVRAATRAVDPFYRLLLPSGIVAGRHGSYLALKPFLVDGAGYGGLVGNVVDAARFLRLHLGDGVVGGRRVLQESTARGMRHGHAVGWFRCSAGPQTEPYVEQFGSGAGFWNVMRIYPERNLGIVVMANSTHSYDFEALFQRLLREPWPHLGSSESL